MSDSDTIWSFEHEGDRDAWVSRDPDPCDPTRRALDQQDLTERDRRRVMRADRAKTLALVAGWAMPLIATARFLALFC